MEDTATLIGSLIERVADYSKTGYQLIKLKTVDKTADVVSTVVPHSVVIVFIASFLIFINLGLAFWLGEIFGRMFYGFFAVGAFYGTLALIFHFFLHKWLKKTVGDYFIKRVLN